MVGTKSRAEVPRPRCRILPGRGHLRSQPEESALWSTLSDDNDLPGYEDRRIAVHDWARRRLLQWPMNFDLKADDLKIQLEARAPKRLGEFISGTIGRVCFTGADDLFFVDEHLIRRICLQTLGIARFAVGDSFRKWSHAEVYCISPYKTTGQLLTESESTPIRSYLDPWQKFLGSRLLYGETQDERSLKWWDRGSGTTCQENFSHIRSRNFVRRAHSNDFRRQDRS